MLSRHIEDDPGDGPELLRHAVRRTSGGSEGLTEAVRLGDTAQRLNIDLPHAVGLRDRVGPENDVTIVSRSWWRGARPPCRGGGSRGFVVTHGSVEWHQPALDGAPARP
ncbi:MAG: hypothetical protein IPL40_07005 [Proteobacteria bacterium]|nr:hypothetical protein [Pseudomonadota bacterium]